MRNEREMVRAVMPGGNWRAGLTFDDAGLAAIEQPNHYPADVPAREDAGEGE